MAWTLACFCRWIFLLLENFCAFYYEMVILCPSSVKRFKAGH